MKVKSHLYLSLPIAMGLLSLATNGYTVGNDAHAAGSHYLMLAAADDDEEDDEEEEAVDYRDRVRGKWPLEETPAMQPKQSSLPGATVF